MVMKNSYPDYNKITEITKELYRITAYMEEAHYDCDYEVYNKEQKLIEDLITVYKSDAIEVKGKTCRDCNKYNRNSNIYYPGKIHHVDGDVNNDSFGNLAMVCPKCQSHILLSRFSPEEIWLIKARGLSYAEIGRLLNLSRERVRQLCKKYKAIEDAKLAKLAESDLDHLIKKAEFLENYLIADGKLTRRIDRRTKKKRILAELDKLKSKDI